MAFSRCRFFNDFGIDLAYGRDYIFVDVKAWNWIDHLDASHNDIFPRGLAPLIRTVDKNILPI